MSKFFRTALVVSSIFLTAFYLAGLMVYQVSPLEFWPIGIIGIGFFYIALALALCTIAWLFYRKKVSALLFVLLLCGLPVLKNVISINKRQKFEVNKSAGSLRVMQWNCQGLQGYSDYQPQWLVERKKAVNFIRKYQPDIICVQDFGEAMGPTLLSNIALLRDTLTYPYVAFSRHYRMTRPWGITYTGIAIFSKLPFSDTGRINYPRKTKPESILWADLEFGGKKIRVTTTHLQSMHLWADYSREPLDSSHRQDSTIIVGANIFKKLRYFQSYHVRQANTLRAFIDTSQMPLLLAADLNSVPSSFVYRKIRGDLKDAFLEQGLGLGKTYHSVQPALRIDYLFYNDAFRLSQVGVFHRSFSDHDPVIMDVQLIQ